MHPTASAADAGEKLNAVIIGGGEPAEELIELVRAEPSLELIGILDPDNEIKGTSILDVPVLGWLTDLPIKTDVAIIGQPHRSHGFDREAVFYLIVQKGLNIPSFIAESARADDVPLRRGTIVLSDALIATDAMLGENCLIGHGVSIEPGATVTDHSYISPETIVDIESVAQNASARKDLQAVVASSSEPLNVIIRRISWSNMEIILVVDGAGGLIGTVTDGDVRRGILSGVSLDDPVSVVMNPTPIAVDESTEREAMLQLMRKHSIRHLPVLDEHRQPVRIERMEHLVDDITAQAVVMAGGLGTRLQPYTNDTPKPLVSVAGRPILDHTLSRLKRSGIENVVISLNHLGEQIRRHIGTGRRRDLKVDYVSETQRLGTAGALTLLDPRPEKPFLVMNGDLVTKLNFSRLIRFHTKGEYDMSLCVRKHSLQIPYGVVDVEDGCVQELREKPMIDSFINAGIYVLSPECIDLIPAGSYFDMTDLYNAVRANGGKVGAFPIVEYWRDIGRPEDLAAAHEEHEASFLDIPAPTASIPMEIIG